jgi:hypothetical protein
MTAMPCSDEAAVLENAAKNNVLYSFYYSQTFAPW